MQSDLSADELARLIERLRDTCSTGYEWSEAFKDWFPTEPVLRNPDGPAAADTILAQQQRIEGLCKDIVEYQDHVADLVEANDEQAQRIEALEAALIDHNDRLRSAVQIADRDGKDTNWLSFRGQVRYTLAEHQETVNTARAALGSAPDAH